MAPREPVAGFPMRFEWSDDWAKIFDKQIALIRDDLNRAVAEDRLIVYLSCPISSRGGGHAGTNVEIAKFVENRLMDRFGERFWVLNPARYQMESKEGTGLIVKHAKELGITPEKLAALGRAGGGDYMRMWTQVLVENRRTEPAPPQQHVGSYFDMYYFLGPADAAEFFVQGTAQNMTAAVEGYFARKFATDADFRREYRAHGDDTPQWEDQRKAFFRYYAVKVGASFSLGSHDEWNIFLELNRRRREMAAQVGDQLAGFFEGRQIDPAAGEARVSPGYAT